MTEPVPTERTQPMSIVPPQTVAHPAVTPPAAPAPAPATRRGGGFTVMVALLALLVALTAAGLSVYAIGIAHGARNDVASTGSPAGPATHPGAAPAPTSARTTATNAPAASPGVLDPSANFTLAYTPEEQTLVIHIPQGGGTNDVDLDKPAVNVGGDGNPDLDLYNGDSEVFTFPQGVQAATASSANLDASDCATLIQTSALAQNTTVPVKTPGLVLCVLTNFDDAQTQGISWKIALVQVTSVAQDGSVQVAVKAWIIPN